MAVDYGIVFVRKHIHNLSFGLRYGGAKRRTHDHKHPNHFPQLLGRLRDGSDIVSVRHAPKRRLQDWLSYGCFPPPSRPRFLPQMHQSVLRLEMHVGYVYNHREEYVEQKGRKRATLTKALLHSEPPRGHPVVEQHACSHAIIELTNDGDHILWHAKTGEYSPGECSINGVVCFGKVDKAYIQRNSFLPRQLP